MLTSSASSASSASNAPRSDTQDVSKLMLNLGQQARLAAPLMAAAPSARKDAALAHLAELLHTSKSSIFEANEQDLAFARSQGAEPYTLDRLRIDASVLARMIEGVRQVLQLADPIGEVLHLRARPSGIQVGQMRVPLGVLGMIYESRPNVTIEAASLAIKSGNAIILRGGSEAQHSNAALSEIVREALQAASLPTHAVQLIPTSDRAAVGALLGLSEFVDVIIPRGGKSLIERVSREARMPVIKHLDGNCHVYVDAPCDLDMALALCINAKTQRLSTCNTAESLLVARPVAAALLPRLGARLAELGVEMRADAEAQALLHGLPRVVPATERDWSEEYLAAIISVKVVTGLDEAIAHINRYGSHHTDAIVTTEHQHAMRFLREVDSACVHVNASTRFADGFEYGLGAEIGISTDKFHARGPVGLEGLTSLKWVVLGHGEVRTA